jgi:hypothetical protein
VSKPLEEAQAKLTKQMEDIVPDAMVGVLHPATLQPGQMGGQAPAGADPLSVLRSIYSSALRAKPDLADKAMRLGLPEGDPERWEPGAKKDETKDESIQDFYAVQQIQAVADVISKHLEDAPSDPQFQSAVSDWITGLSEAQAYQAGFSDDVASVVAGAKRGGVAMPPEVMRRAVSQVISKWNEVHHDQVHLPANNNTVMSTYRSDNYHAEWMQDAIGTAYVSRMSPEELQDMEKTGVTPPVLAEELKRGGQTGLFRAPVGLVQGVATLMNKPGSRRSLHEYVRGGLDPEDEKVLQDPDYNSVRAFYESKANFEPGPDGKPKPNPYRRIIDRLHADRARSKAAMQQPVSPTEGYGALGAAAGAVGSTVRGIGDAALRGGAAIPVGAAKGLRAAIGPKGMQAGITAGMKIGRGLGFGEPEQPVGEPDQLAPQPELGGGQ